MMSRQRQRIYFLICAVLLAVIGVAGWNVASILLEYRAGEQTYAQIAKISRSEPEADTPIINDGAAARDFSALQKINPNIVAWVSIPGTNIDYPVVQGADNSYYLTHLVTGEWNSSGSIFLDHAASPDFSDSYSIVYGHNMLNKTMFSSLMDYKTQDFYQAHPTGILETPQRNYEILFFAGFVADTDHPVWNTNLQTESVAEWGAEMYRHSYFQSNILPSADDCLIALATCSYEFDNARFILLGILR